MGDSPDNLANFAEYFQTPGQVLREDFLQPSGLDAESLAHNIGVTHQTVESVLSGQAPITGDLALRLGKFLGTSPESWMALQADFDLGQARETTDLSDITPL